MRQRLFVLILTAALIVIPAFAHDNNTTHTRITESALVVVEAAAARESDEERRDAYAELARDDRRWWGADRRYNEAQSLDLGHDEFLARPYTVVAGSVLEDAPATRVGTHFYNAYTGAGIHPQLQYLSGDQHDSEVVGHRYFDQAIEVFGYEESDGSITLPINTGSIAGTQEVTFTVPPSKELGLFLFGHSLHHVEDISSIAHSHNDVHLTLGRARNANLEQLIGVAEVDDYEAIYLPTLLWDANSQINQFGLASDRVKNSFPEYEQCSQGCSRQAPASTIPPVAVANFTDIWAEADQPAGLQLGPSGELINSAAGLGRSVVNLSVFQGDLEKDMDMSDTGCAEETATTAPRLSGEILEMFGTTDQSTCRIHFNLDNDTGNLSWLISEFEILVDGVATMSPGPGRFHSHGTPFWIIYNVGLLDLDGLAGMLIPEESWWPIGVVGGPTDQLNGGDYYYFEQLMQGIIAGAAFDQTQLLRPPKIRQDLTRRYDPSGGNTVEDSPLFVEFGKTQPAALTTRFAEHLVPLGIQYAAGFSQFWYDIANLPPYLKKVTIEQDDETRYEAIWTDISEVRSMEFINEMIGINVEKMFNYVKERNLSITVIDHIDPSQSFKVITEFNEPVQRDTGTQEIKLYINNQEIAYTNQKATPSPNGEAWYSNREFEMTVDNLAAAFPGGLPEGEVTLTVQAFDRNYHRDGVDQIPIFGTEIDQDPSTPARRQRINPDVPRQDAAFPKADWGQAKWGDYPWHDDTSVDVDFPDMDTGDFEYNRGGNGDSTHVLLFDDSPPEASLTVQ